VGRTKGLNLIEMNRRLLISPRDPYFVIYRLRAGVQQKTKMKLNVFGRRTKKIRCAHTTRAARVESYISMAYGSFRINSSPR
jgi:hypothetical protein